MVFREYESLTLQMEGISFIVRIRDEEETLEQSIRSLFEIQVPHEILLILHLCKDHSKEIAQQLARENPNIRVLEYNTPISRAGYETLCTDKDSPHSIMTYYTWCYNQANYAWKFKWDADFVSTPSLIEYINGCRWGYSSQSVALYIEALSGDSSNRERYIICGDFAFHKYYFWEQIELKQPIHTIYPEHVTIFHDSLLAHKKKYWNYVPWFLDSKYLEAHPEHIREAFCVANRYVKVIELCGPEPNGQARASNPECKDVHYAVIQHEHALKEYGISSAF